MKTYTAGEVGKDFRCSSRKVRTAAALYGIGANLGGRAGWRFTEADKDALLKAMTPAKAVVVRRRRRAA